MTRIRVDPNRLRQGQSQFSAAAAQLRGIDSHVAAAWGGLSWEARQTAGIGARVDAARARARALAEEADGLARYLGIKVEAFGGADTQGLQDVTAVAAAVTAYQRAVAGLSVDKMIDVLLGGGTQLLGWEDQRKAILSVLAPLGLTYTLREGKVIIQGSRWMKEAAGLSPYLTRIAPSNLPQHMIDHITGGALLLPVAEQWLTDIHDFHEHGGAPATLAATLFVDAAYKAGIGVVAGVGGTWLGTAAVGAGAAVLFGATAPAWAVVAGGAVGAIALGWAGEQAFQWLETSGVRNYLIHSTAETFADAGMGAQVLAGQATQAVSAAATDVVHTVDHALDSAISAIHNARLPQLWPA
jgi:hypothetical protein